MGIAISLAQYLVDRDIDYDLIPHCHTMTASGSAIASGVSADRVVKAVVLKRYHGFVIALLPASRDLQLNALQRMLGDDVDLANEEQAETLFPDCEPGAIPALSAAYGLDAVVDDTLAQQPEIYFEAGDHANLVHITGTSFRGLTAGARYGQFTAPAHSAVIAR
jgi:Ala-tRNA(Pro) deacylase